MKSPARVVFVAVVLAALAVACTSGPSNGPSSSSTSDLSAAGSNGSPAASCAGDTHVGAPIRSAACQACLDTKCCPEVTKCMGLDVGSGGVTCSDYADCLAKCPDNDETCFDACDTASGQSLVQAFEALAECSAAPGNCSDACK